MEKLLKNPYIELLRVNHWFKNSFVFVGSFFAIWYSNKLFLLRELIVPIFIGLLLASLISSANYIINQLVDAKFDKRHPYKKERPIPSGRVPVEVAWKIFVALFIIGMLVASQLFSRNFVLLLFIFWIAGLAYNIPPVRLKDIPYIDVLAESVNNPIRFLLGWFIVAPSNWPPLLILLLTWGGGAFLMTAKRYDELRTLGNKLVPYRRTFETYTPNSLRLSLYVYYAITLALLGYASWLYEKKFILIWFPTAIFLIWVMREVISGKANARNIEAFVLTPRFLIGTLTLLFLFILLAFW